MNNLILHIFITVFAAFIAVNSWSQNPVSIDALPKKYSNLYKSAQSDSRKGDYQKALPKLNKILKANPNCAEIYIKKAGVLYNLKDTTQAVFTLSSAIEKFKTDVPELYFTRGYMYFEKKQYNLAKHDFKTYLDGSTLSEDRFSKTKYLYDISNFRDSLLSNPVTYEPVLLPGTINTPYSEYSPSLSIDGRYLVFTRRVNQQEDLMVSYVDSFQGYSTAFPLLDINTPANEGAHCVSADGKLILFTGCDRGPLHRGCDIYYSVFTDNAWTKPANVGKTINTPAWESQPNLSADGKTLFFVSDRVGGFGGRDIWFSKKNHKNVWSIPENLGPVINTVKDDETPFLHPDGKTLYWRSNGRMGMGDFDIYTAKWNPVSQSWENIQNLGSPINTENSEGGLVVSLDGTKAFFATDLFSSPSESRKNLDICTFSLPSYAKATPTTFVKLLVFDKKTNEKLSAQVEIQNISSKQTFYAGKTNSSGNLLIPIHGNALYAFHISKENYAFVSEQIDVSNLTELFDPYIISIGLEPLASKEPASIILHNVFFETGSFEILPASYAEIDNLYQFLIQNPSLKIKIVGHTDNVGSSSANLILSEKRALSVKKAIEDKGVTPDRILFEGMGQEKPLESNETPEGRQRNRRTECIILSD